jgi:ABC-type sugar transport system ATPase subunit
MSDVAPLLEMRGVSKAFFGVEVLRDVSLSLAPGRVLGLVGENGAGKSTLMNILGGLLPTDGGTITLAGEDYVPSGPRDAAARGIAFIHQELNLFPNLSINDNIFITGYPRQRGTRLLAKGRATERTRSLLAEVGLDRDPETLVEHLSPGERQLVEIAKALDARARIVIFDEPTTSLTARETERLFSLIEKLTAGDTAVIYISHILSDVVLLADEVAVLRDGQLAGSGPVAEFPTASMISLMVGRRLDQLYPERTSTPTETPLLRVENVSQPGIVEDISFEVHAGEVVGLFGLMGAGRTELARIIFGLDSYAQGSVWVGDEVVKAGGPRRRISKRMALVTEDRRTEGLLMESSVIDNVGLVALPSFARTPLRMVNTSALASSVTRVISSLRLKAANLNRQPVRSLSGGGQQKVVLGKWLLTEPRVVILDEPTRGIDVGAKHEVYTVIDGLAAGGAGLLMISSELAELRGLCDRILVMSRGRLVGEFVRADFDAGAILAAAFGESRPVDSEGVSA